MTSVTWHRMRAALGRRFPDRWLWGAFALTGAIWWGFVLLGTLPDGITIKLLVALTSFCGLLISVIGLFRCKSWGWLAAALALGIIGLFFAVGPKASYLLVGFHLYYAYEYWRGYRSFARVSRPEDANPY